MPGVDDDLRDARLRPVIWSVATGVAPLPFLAVYAILFIARGTVHPVIPPDIGNSKGDELVAGLIALAARSSVPWPLLVPGRPAPLAVRDLPARHAGDLDRLPGRPTKGPPAIPVVLAVTSLTALVLAFAAGIVGAHAPRCARVAAPAGGSRNVDPVNSGLPAQSPDISA